MQSYSCTFKTCRLQYVSFVNPFNLSQNISKKYLKMCEVLVIFSFSFFFGRKEVISAEAGRWFLLMQPCGGGTRTREGALVSTIIRVSSRRMSFINARGKLRPYTCIYTRVRREGEREGTVRRGCRERVRRGRWRRGRGKTTEAKYPSFCFVLGGWVLSLCAFPFPLPPPPASSRSLFYYYYFLSQYLLFPHSVLC